MTDPLIPAQHVVVNAELGSRLEALALDYAAAKPAADAAKARLDEAADRLKLALSEAAPEGATKIDLHAAGLEVPLRLGARTSWRLDTARLKAEQPELYVRYAKQASFWELRAVTKRGQQ